MKKFIKWLADLSGVTDDIQREHCKFIGGQMKQYAYYFGDTHIVHIAYKEYAERCLLNGDPNLYYTQPSELRTFLINELHGE